MSLLTDEEIEAIWCNSNPTYFEAQSFARAVEAAILAKLASAELPEPVELNPSANSVTGYTADQLRQAFAQGAASQLAEKPVAEINNENGSMPVVWWKKRAHLRLPTGTKLFTLKEPK